jgi:erythromycin esterase-like protein
MRMVSRELVSRVNPAVVDKIQRATRPLTGAAGDYDALLEPIGDARFVLIGEASHGTHEFYRDRARITQRLIVEKGFAAVAVEADWPDAYRVNRYVRATAEDTESVQALAGFERFPTWMWRHYFQARLADQFDAVIHFDDTRAVEPLERTAKWETGEVWETFPSGM